MTKRELIDQLMACDAPDGAMVLSSSDRMTKIDRVIGARVTESQCSPPDKDLDQGDPIIILEAFIPAWVEWAELMDGTCPHCGGVRGEGYWGAELAGCECDA